MALLTSKSYTGPWGALKDAASSAKNDEPEIQGLLFIVHMHTHTHTLTHPHIHTPTHCDIVITNIAGMNNYNPQTPTHPHTHALTQAYWQTHINSRREHPRTHTHIDSPLGIVWGLPLVRLAQ